MRSTDENRPSVLLKNIVIRFRLHLDLIGLNEGPYAFFGICSLASFSKPVQYDARRYESYHTTMSVSDLLNEPFKLKLTNFVL